ncbi:MAG: P1 family peptidase [Actinomycetota bacterium]|nr:P1 family peptidase [Actinomycetota bacterium]
MITDVAGVRVGHWTDEAGRTGCTVVLFPAGTVASGEVRGGAPGTREWELLAPERVVDHLDAVILCGGSAFGLAAADGVMRWCEERGMGFPTPAGPVPIVVGAVLYDLLVGDAGARPDAASGYAACGVATAGEVPSGQVGAGAGATVSKWRGRESARPGGVGTASARHGDVVVGAVMAVNAFGDVLAADQRRRQIAPSLPSRPTQAFPGGNTTIGVVATNADLDKVGCLLVAQSAHDGLARALDPVHTTFDGDAVVAAATGAVSAPVDDVRILAARVVEEAVRAGATAVVRPSPPSSAPSSAPS